MTEYEIADLAFSQQFEIQGLGDGMMTMLALIAEAITQYMSVLFGYIATAYFVGAKLTRTQLWIFSVLYVFWQLLTISMIGFRSGSAALIASRIQDLLLRTDATQHSEFMSSSPAWIGSSLVTLLLLALLASLYFMWSVRRPASE